MPEFLFHFPFWLSVLQIIAIDILLGGDNAVVIALACHRLPQQQRTKGIVWGVVGAIALRILLIFFALKLLALPYVKIVGALLLLWIGVKLLRSEEEGEHQLEGAPSLLGAIRTIVVADAVMSMDNVIAVSAASADNLWLVVFGITASIPIIVWGSTLILRLMDRYPLIITLGAALLGWIAGSMIVGDIALRSLVADAAPRLQWLTGALGAGMVVAVGHALARHADAAVAVRREK